MVALESNVYKFFHFLIRNENNNCIIKVLLQKIMSSCTRKLQHEISQFTEKSDIKIPENTRYIVTMEIFGVPQSDIQKSAQKFLHSNRDHIPIFVYTFTNRIYLCFDEETIYRDGSVQKICSEYSSILTKWLNPDCPVITTLVYLDTRMHVYAYLVWELYSLMRESMRKLAINISKKESVNLTLEELSKRLEIDNISWTHKSVEEKYGVFYRFKLNKGKKVILGFSKKLDFQDYNEHIKLLFD